MTDKLHCPFCGAEIKPLYDFYICSNPTLRCKAVSLQGSIEIWQALIDGKKAQDALKVARHMYKSAQKAYIEKLFGGFPNTIKSLVAAEIHKYDDKITSLTKGK